MGLFYHIMILFFRNRHYSLCLRTNLYKLVVATNQNKLSMKAVEYRLPKEFDKSFIVFRERGLFFPCPWHYHPEYEFVLVNKSTGRRMVGDHIGSFAAGDLVLMGPGLPHVWVNDQNYFKEDNCTEADAVVVHFMDDFLGENFFNLPETEALTKVLDLSHRGLVITGSTRY